MFNVTPPQFPSDEEASVTLDISDELLAARNEAMKVRVCVCVCVCVCLHVCVCACVCCVDWLCRCAPQHPPPHPHPKPPPPQDKAQLSKQMSGRAADVFARVRRPARPPDPTLCALRSERPFGSPPTPPPPPCS